MDYSVFDSLLDSVFVVSMDRTIVYCNDAAANLCESSVRRLTKGVRLFQVLNFEEDRLFVMPSGDQGRDAPLPFTEVEFQVVSADKKGKVQIAIQPFTDDNKPYWVVLIRDVTLEEVLAGKYRGELEQKEKYIAELRQAQQELEQYSKNLEKMVQERTAEVQHANQMLSAIMNSLGQGFLVFDAQGVCGSIFTKACLDVLECHPAGMKIWELLKLFGPERTEFIGWVQATFSEALPFDNMIELAPRLFKHSDDRHVTLDYYPLRDSDGAITALVLVATDKTTEFETALALEKEKSNAQMVLKIVRSRDQFAQFLSGARTMIAELLKRAKTQDMEQIEVPDMFRKLHTLEGEAALYSLASVRDASRVAQEALEPVKRGENFDQKSLIRQINQTLVDLNKTFETFLTEHKALFDVLNLEKGRKLEVPYNKILAFRTLLERHGVPTGLLQDYDDDFLRVPIKTCLRPLEEAALVVAAKQNKQLKPVHLDTGAVHIIVDNYEKLFASLVHAVRNAVDHGIEDPTERLECGKNEAGQISIRAQWVVRGSGRWLRIAIQDDGRGIDANRIRAKLDQRYPSVDWREHSDQEVLQHVFEAGLSSRDEVGEFSGRGIGMDAILTEARQMGGEAVIESEVGHGTTLIVEVPDQPQLQVTRIGA
jgi:two-component system chemotaxis sensor kinase CheA